ncbi:extracellular matrix regulator RemB [Tissierella creatinophila]|uniref:Uncharacterized protein n=1 Tax=Tissierella creatinophila DSM 6911 TaxID=1123403 RepID=A0A1U7M5X6_TISCR|nr:extracellular matrix/biofilm biosynthesis regulator RemA family protein [Tissierella creatinophila]OLS02723.1 hypothetical protein TICRE_13140 [Tissierella creatinophila DSM 6911]
MNICIGENIFISKKDIIAVLDYETIIKSKDGKAFIKWYEKNAFIHHIKKEVKSYIVTTNGDNIKIYESNISSNSIKNKFKLKGLKELDD